MTLGRPENIPVQITIIKLTKKNYLTWATAMKMVIAGRDCDNYIDGKIKKPNKVSSSWNRWYFEDN